jgi:Plexin repeat
MRTLRWMCLALTISACSAKGGTGFGGPSPDTDASVGDDTNATVDSAPTPDGPVSPDSTVTPDIPASPDAPAMMDVIGKDLPVQPDVPAQPDLPAPPDVPRDVGPLCGDGVCNGVETCSSCERDCGPCPPPPDVPVELFCGDSICTSSRGENCTTCSADCGPCAPDVPPTDPCALFATCGTCSGAAASVGCGWCSNAGRCVAGSSTGPTTAILGCTTTAGTWVRTSTSCGGTTTSVTAACTVASMGTARDCGWRTSGTFTCTPGRLTTVGCNSTTSTTSPLCAPTIGSCVGDPILRVCPGSAPCTSATALVPSVGNADDLCGTCPVVQITCPTSGQINVLTGDYNTSTTSTQRGTCSPAVR